MRRGRRLRYEITAASVSRLESHDLVAIIAVVHGCTQADLYCCGLVRDNYGVNQEMSPRLAALIKKIENDAPELSAEMFQVPGEKQDD